MNENAEAQYMIDVRNAAEYLLARGVPQNEIIPYIEKAAADVMGRILHTTSQGTNPDWAAGLATQEPPKLEQLIKAAAYLSQQIEHLPEREGFDLHGLVRGTVIGVRKASSPEAYAVWLAIVNWKDALNELDKLREELAQTEAARRSERNRHWQEAPAKAWRINELQEENAAMRAEIDALKSEIELLRVELGNRPSPGQKPVDVWPDRW